MIINKEDNTASSTHIWLNQAVISKDFSSEKIPTTEFPWWIEELDKYGFVYIQDVNKMPKEAKLDYAKVISKDTKSLVLLPVKEKDQIKGFIGLNSEKSYKTWSDQEMSILNILANILATGISKIKAEEEVDFLAYFDNLTRLPNRVLFKDRVDQSIKLAKRHTGILSVIFIDLDNFKAVNDTIGHDGGDELLVKLSERIVARLRKSDTVARFGGDEFMVLLNNITSYKALSKIVENIMGIFKEPFIIKNQHFLVTASGGVASYPIDGEDADSLIKNADMAMYEAKSQGKNQFAFCTKEMKEDLEKNILLSNDLHLAIREKQLLVYYQPQVNLKTGKIEGLEALVRWNHPKFGIISPGVFIPLAEKNNLINSIGDWVLRTACKQNKKWQDMGLGKFTVAVNLSAIQFAKPGISYDIKRALKESGLSPKYLEIEITEGVAIKQTEYALNVLNELKEIGVSISIDDFGTEYSSLSRLKVLPVDRIKIDMQFIQGIERDQKDRAITMVVINLAKNLGLNVLAEGVETKAQLDFLIDKRCDHIQGYYYYRPMPAEDIEKILAENSFKSLVEYMID